MWEKGKGMPSSSVSPSGGVVMRCLASGSIWDPAICGQLGSSLVGVPAAFFNTTQRLPSLQTGREDPRRLPGTHGVGSVAPGGHVPQRGVWGTEEVSGQSANVSQCQKYSTVALWKPEYHELVKRKPRPRELSGKVDLPRASP
ncbi:hypothetical protein E2C01_036760 [Portunus trituberculatus]|uniref:Uncharacterized protein n=1 Tax=Portunus trituberculatus TaxID=210409 RepID=A0A5B7FDB7_PORTR|nr:hypothetical protein [Portunus trituberculatus]